MKSQAYHQDELHFDGLVILITGAGRGLGACYAHYLADRGAHVIVNDLGVSISGAGRDPGIAALRAQEIVAKGGLAEADGSDMGNRAEIDDLVGRLIERHGRLDGVIINAGLFPEPAAFTDTPASSFALAWSSHVYSAIQLCQAVLPHMERAGYGRIVTSCSIQAFYGAAESSAYAAAKGAVAGLTRSLAAGLHGTGISINAISPGGYTRMVERAATDPGHAALLERSLPLSAVAPAAAWLCHPVCGENGAIIQAMAGRFSRTATIDCDSFWAPEPTVGLIAEGFAGGPRFERPVTASSSRELARAIAAEAGTRSAELPAEH